MFSPSKMGYFDLAGDPLSQAAERASLCLFLRGDLKPAPHRLAVVMTDADLAKPPSRIPSLHPKWHWMAWVTRVGTQVAPSPREADPLDVLLPIAWQTPASAYPEKLVEPINPYGADDAALLGLLKSRGILSAGNPTDPSRKILRSETGEVLIDGTRDLLVLDTARTAGGSAPAGQTIETQTGGVRVAVEGTDATVWVSSLDGGPIRESQRLLVTHLTDLQNTEIRYREPARQTLLNWGRLPHLVRAGKAEVAIRLSQAADYRVWALAPSGKRLAEVSAKVEGGTLRFVADVAGDVAAGARMLYEVAVR
jgi:hypothetical protein